MSCLRGWLGMSGEYALMGMEAMFGSGEEAAFSFHSTTVVSLLK